MLAWWQTKDTMAQIRWDWDHAFLDQSKPHPVCQVWGPMTLSQEVLQIETVEAYLQAEEHHCPHNTRERTTGLDLESD